MFAVVVGSSHPGTIVLRPVTQISPDALATFFSVNVRRRSRTLSGLISFGIPL